MTSHESSQSPRFVIQQHQTTDGIHWDLMIQHDDALWTWRMDCPPAAIADTPLPLVRIADHPLRFLTYEGPVQHQTGHVHIADSGNIEMIDEAANTLKIVFDGQILNGPFLLSRQNDTQYRLSRQKP